MAYKIYGADIPKVDITSGYVISLSSNGTYALINSSNLPQNIEIIEIVDDSSINSLLELPEWKQPCLNCT